MLSDGRSTMSTVEQQWHREVSEVRTAMDYVIYQLSLPKDLKDRLRNINQQTGIPMAKIVRDILEQHLEDVEKRHGIQIQLPTDSSPNPK